MSIRIIRVRRTMPVTLITFLILGALGRTDVSAFQPSGPRSFVVRTQSSARTHPASFKSRRQPSPQRMSSSNDKDTEEEEEHSRRSGIRKRVSSLAKRLVVKTSSYAAMPQAVASVLKDAALNAVDMAVEEVLATRNGRTESDDSSAVESLTSLDVNDLVDKAFQPLERSLQEVENSLAAARASFQLAKEQSKDAMEAVQAAAIAQAEATATAIQEAERTAGRKALADLYVAAAEGDTIAFEDVDYGTSEMAPPFLGEDQCLVPGEPVVRVEKAPENSRRIFAGIDMLASIDDVWNMLTDYHHLQDVVPNLVVNEVLEEYEGSEEESADRAVSADDTDDGEARQCMEQARRMKGARLRQVGGAKVAGIRFSARTTLEVREWPQGLPDYAHFNDEIWEGKSRKERAKEYARMPLQRYRFPRPFAVSSLPTRDISMQSIENDDGEFRMYQGVWRMQPLPGCAPPGQQAMRLTYAVEVSPRAYLPVSLIEGRIVRDLCNNLEAIRDFATKEAKEQRATGASR